MLHFVEGFMIGMFLGVIFLGLALPSNFLHIRRPRP